MIRRLRRLILCETIGLHDSVLRVDVDGISLVSVCRRCEPLRFAILDELAATRPPFGYVSSALQWQLDLQAANTAQEALAAAKPGTPEFYLALRDAHNAIADLA